MLGGDAEDEGDASMAFGGICGNEGDADSKGLWLRYTDRETGLAYYMNDETGVDDIRQASALHGSLYLWSHGRFRPRLFGGAPLRRDVP